MSNIDLLKNSEHTVLEKVLNLFPPERVICLLFYGSNAFKRSEHRSSDYDFYILLNKYESGDTNNLKDVVSCFNEGKTIDLTYQYLEDIERVGWDSYQLGNHGVFYILNFAQAITLYGTNVFQRRLSQLHSNLITDSIMRQIQEYFWRLDDWIIKEEWNENLISKYKKYLIRIAYDFMVSKADISFAEINSYKFHEIADLASTKDYFSSNTKQVLKDVFHSSYENISNFLALKRSLYEDFILLSNSKEYSYV